MQDVIVTSAIDFKTYLAIVYRTYFGKRIFLFLGITFVITLVSLLTDPHIDWNYELDMLVFFVGMYLILLPVLIYFTAKVAFKRNPYLQEPLSYALNEDKIEVKGDTFNNTGNWQYTTMLVEREKYFMLRNTTRTFHYLPKAGFETLEDINRLKAIVKEKGIKFSYK